jgi:phage-related protein
MAINPFIYSRSLSIDSSYSNQSDLSIYKPIYGSNVSFSSKVNFLQSVDNSLKIQPNSENNLIAKFNLRFLLNDLMTGNLLKTIEISGGTRYLKFIDPSSFYDDFNGLILDYKVSKQSKNLNVVEIYLINNYSSPIFNWTKSCFLKNINIANNSHTPSRSYSKYDIVYNDNSAYKLQNNTDNFWFANKDIPSNMAFSLDNFTKNFIHETKYPFELSNSLDIKAVEYKNSFTQYVRDKTNINTLKNFPMRFESISDLQCKSILFFLEKKLGYKKFIYEFPLFFNKNKIFVCLNWKHTFNYFNSHEITLELNEDPTGEEVISKNGFYYINTN